DADLGWIDGFERNGVRRDVRNLRRRYGCLGRREDLPTRLRSATANAGCGRRLVRQLRVEGADERGAGRRPDNAVNEDFGVLLEGDDGIERLRPFDPVDFGLVVAEPAKAFLIPGDLARIRPRLRPGAVIAEEEQ